MSINFELYKVFYTTATLGSFSKAAKQLYTSQPAISQAIKQLENQLGGLLFQRNARGVSLTAEGKVLYQYIEQGYSLIKAGENRFFQLKEMTSGELRLAVCSSVCKYDLLDDITEYNRRYPAIHLSIQDESSTKISQLLEKGEIDIGIINPHHIQSDDFVVVKTLKMQDYFVVGQQYKHLCQNTISIHSLVDNYPLIMLQKGGSTRFFMEDYFLSHGITISPQIELSNLDLIVEFAIKGLGIGCVMKEHVQEELKKGDLFMLNVQEVIPNRSLHVVIKKDMPLSTATKRFIELMIG
ncbi:LysR family transcriptional regulator [Scatolibacter rhodanostii]|uniref:LysR family transcriptional regulator n=1 Tax=Scatolibacter rhodanostii TaxID=2014781 RepID=UPI000C0702DD|nr:LysR family transcriptional regulator [Scatolibacter rhodanostii]